MKVRSGGVTDDPVVRRLREIRKESPGLEGAARVYEAVLPVLRDANLHVAPVFLTSEQARRKMEEGVPLLDGLDIEIDLREAKELMLQLSRALQMRMKNSHVSDMTIALEEDRLDIGMLLSETVAGWKESSNSFAGGPGLQPDLLRTVSGFTLRPAMQAVRSQLSPLVAGIEWHKGICYVCGTGAALAELQGSNQEKHLRCVQCGADWPARRLQCACCGNEDHRTLGYLQQEKNIETMRVEVCEKCRGYLKVIVSFSPSPPEMLPVKDLATLHLDYIAQEKGYTSSAQRPYCGSNQQQV